MIIHTSSFPGRGGGGGGYYHVCYRTDRVGLICKGPRTRE